jgi:hypothetical protein
LFCKKSIFSAYLKKRSSLSSTTPVLYIGTYVVVNAAVVGLAPRADPTIASYSATSSLVRFEDKNILFSNEKRSSVL